MTSGIASHQPESARGTIGSSTRMPSESSAKPARMMLAGRRSPARLPASIATKNMLSDSGASDRPACSALYSSTIWRKIGSEIIAPPSAICWSVCPEMPSRKMHRREQVRIDERQLRRRACAGRATRRTGRATRRRSPAARRRPRRPPPTPGCPARCRPCPAPTGSRPTRSMPRGPVYGTSLTIRMPDSTTPMTTSSSRNPTRHDRNVVMKPPSERPDGGGDGGGGADQRVDPLLGGALEVAVDERLHRGQQQRRAESAADGPEDDDRAAGPGRAPSRGRRPRSPAGPARRRACGR